MKPDRSNKTHCPCCENEWDLCDCEQTYPESDLIKMDDEFIASSIDFEI